MHRRRLAVVVVLSFATVIFTTTPALATIARTYVASFGNDADPCTLAAPCRTLTHALTETSSAGEIIILDSGDYDSVSIAQSVSILASEGIYAGIRVTSGHGITVNGSNIAVVLRGLSIKGTNTGYGVYFQSGASLHIEKAVFHIPGWRAINVEASGEMFVSDTVFHDSGNPAVVSSSASATFVRVLSLNSIGFGFNFEGGKIALRDVVIAGANGYGILANTNEGGTVKLTVDRTTVRGNAGTGIAAGGSGTYVVVTRSTITGNAGDALDATGNAVAVISDSTLTGNSDYAFYIAGGGVIKSTGDNTVEGNGAGTILGGSLTSLTKQ